MAKIFATCNRVTCGRWGAVPAEFDERKHFLVCPHCKEMGWHNFMMPHFSGSHPVKDFAYRADNEVTPIVVSQDEAAI